jgi:hypothetical protein
MKEYQLKIKKTVLATYYGTRQGAQTYFSLIFKAGEIYEK